MLGQKESVLLQLMKCDTSCVKRRWGSWQAGCLETSLSGLDGVCCNR
ncbi:hypothetical protein KHD59_002285 [Sesame phyllody phytoplasma]|uniref:Uncharacterized protein n=1 Tax=Sesame phyllody phytoplasma TaxID=420408 RepID=A0ABS9M3T0_9MOLU|nr:hypothetical protein [Sesame phyllody phytoplasma]